METKNQYTTSYPAQEGNYGQTRFAPVESDATTHAINDLCHELRKMRHEQKKMRREQKKMRHIQEENVRFAEAKVAHCLKNLLMRQSINRTGAFDCDCSSIFPELGPGGRRKKRKTYTIWDYV